MTNPTARAAAPTIDIRLFKVVCRLAITAS
jgi:hypothetical protein